MTMTPDAKKALATTVQSLRERLLRELHDATESAYQLSIPRARDAALSEAGHKRRARLEAWIGEQVRGAVEAALAEKRKPGWTAEKAAEERARIEAKLLSAGLRARVRLDVEKAAAYTLLNRLVLLRLLEAPRRASAQVVTGGWQSGGYRAFREMNPALVRDDESEGYAFVLQMVFEDLAGELPGLFGGASVSELVPVPTPTLRHAVEALDAPALLSCWTDDMTLGWVYQYWNDPEREAIDDKLNKGGKVERHEIASKTQMFTERYMVDWLLQNSLGPMWLALCARNGWTASVIADGTLDRLEARRVEWRARRDAGEVSLTALMPVAGGMEARWAYYVPQPIFGENEPPRRQGAKEGSESVRDWRIIDPAVGSGHFLVVAFDLLVALYREEARQRGEEGQARWTDKAICERILEHNLSGIDIDPRAVQIAAAALWLKARQTCKDARPRRMNLVAAALKLGSLPDTDPALVELRREVERETGIPATLTDQVVHALAGADHLGSLLKVDLAVEAALSAHEVTLSKAGKPVQTSLFATTPVVQRVAIDKEEARATVLERIEGFLGRHTRGDDLGLRLRGEQLAAGVRFVRMVREGSYDLVVGNPPYQGTAKMEDADYVQKTYPRGKADLYAAFLERGLQLVRVGGVSALLTMRNWMFIKQYVGLRTWLLEKHDLRALGDFDKGAFESVPDEVVSVVVSVFRKGDLNRQDAKAPRQNEEREESVALQPTALDDRSRDSERSLRKRAAVLAGVGRIAFQPEALRVVPEWPVVYWWTSAILARYSGHPTLGSLSYTTAGAQTSPQERFVRRPWEVNLAAVWLVRATDLRRPALRTLRFVPYLDGADGAAWFEPLRVVVDWRHAGTILKQWHLYRTGSVSKRVAGEPQYFVDGTAANALGASFSGRAHRWQSITGTLGTTTYPSPDARSVDVLVLFNSTLARFVLASLNPTLHFNVGDVNRLPLFPIANADEIFAVVEEAFGVHESHREPSVEFKCPGPSPWVAAQAWAQMAVDRPEGAPLPPPWRLGALAVQTASAFASSPPLPTDDISYHLGIALGRFHPNGEGILDPATADLSHALPHGILFLDGTTDLSPEQHYLRTDFFSAVHRQMYDNRPIHWPLSSKKKTFVAWVTIHRWTIDTLRHLLADHLYPTQVRLTGELTDLRATRDGADKTAARNAEKRLAKVKPALDELGEFIAAVEQCAERGPLDGNRERDARYAPDLDDGVMINSAALHPLLSPQWKDPAKWWAELSKPTDKKHYDWAHLAMRYWPTRVDARCKDDPSLGVAHGCFWAYHPARAWAWELRLQDEIGPDFRIVEAPYRGDGGDPAHRAAYLRDHALLALAAVETEALRRRRKKKAPQAELSLLETGLWSAEPRAAWNLELSILDKQGADFHLRAPDEPAARAALLNAHPALADQRRDRLEAAQVKIRYAAPPSDDEVDDAEEPVEES